MTPLHPDDLAMLERWDDTTAMKLREWFAARDRIAEMGSVPVESVPPEMVDRKVRHDNHA